MNFELAELINPRLQKGEVEQAIAVAEAHLAVVPSTPFHYIIGKSLLHQASDFALWIDDFHRTVTKSFDLKSIYLELNEFDINTDQWYIDGFAYCEDGGSDDPDWLAEVKEAGRTDSIFLLQGYEALQLAFEDADADFDDLQNARDWCEQLIIARFIQLVYAAYRQAKSDNLPWAALSVYCTEHSYDVLFQAVSLE